MRGQPLLFQRTAHAASIAGEQVAVGIIAVAALLHIAGCCAQSLSVVASSPKPSPSLSRYQVVRNGPPLQLLPHGVAGVGGAGIDSVIGVVAVAALRDQAGIGVRNTARC